MLQVTSAGIAIWLALFTNGVIAHPGEKHGHLAVKRELAQRDAYGAHISRSLAKCQRSEKTKRLQSRAVARRASTAKKLKQRRGISTPRYMHRRSLTDLEKWETVSHNETGNITDTSMIFASNTSCVLTPEDVVGPYYVLGELIRSNVTEGEAGVPVHLEMQFVDVSTCDPVEDLFIDIWNANATGVYSGVSSAGEGGLDTTFLRGVQVSNDDGVVEFDTLFPGHYDGRATHTHVLSHANSTALSNGSYSGGTVTHIGQLFFDETLRSAVEKTYPYSTNTQEVVSNDDDMWAPDAASAEYDPFPDYVYLGDDLSDGLLMWISIGVDMSANYTDDATAAAVYAAGGGYDTSSGSGTGGAGAGGSPGNGTMPSGSGTAPSGSGGVPSGSGFVGTGTGLAPSGSGVVISSSGYVGASSALLASGSAATSSAGDTAVSSGGIASSVDSTVAAVGDVAASVTSAVAAAGNAVASSSREVCGGIITSIITMVL